MIFQINKGATLPILQMELVKNATLNIDKFNECIQNSEITFCLTNTETGAKIIGGKPALCSVKYNPVNSFSSTIEEEYLLSYKFTERETKTPGIYVGQFTINFLDDYGKLIVPIKEELFVHILDSSNKK